MPWIQLTNVAKDLQWVNSDKFLTMDWIKDKKWTELWASGLKGSCLCVKEKPDEIFAIILKADALKSLT